MDREALPQSVQPGPEQDAGHEARRDELHPAAIAVPSRRAGVLEWFTRARSLRDAMIARRRSGTRDRELTRRSRLACELADRVFDPNEPLEAGSGDALAADLYRQATYWALCALNHDHDAVVPTPLDVWTAASGKQLDWAVPDAARRETLRRLFVELSFVELAELTAQEQRALAQDSRGLAHAVIELCYGAERRVLLLQRQRFMRTGGLLLACVVLALFGASSIQQARLGADLLVRKPWQASSVWARCDPQSGRCGGLNTEIFFHTQEDKSPWIEYDLGSPQTFSKVYVKNRSDAVPDRAIPLVIEVSNDKRTYREVTRRKRSFKTWLAEFAPQKARYLRLRVDRRSYLHLDAVRAYR